MNRCLQIVCWMLLCLAASAPALGAVDIREFDSETERERYQSFIDQMRCPKCQNQNLAGSDSPIAGDLRDEIYQQIREGRSDKEIVDYMVERYGNYVLYRPPLNAATLALWLGPVLLLVVGLVVLIVVVRRRRSRLADPATDSEQPLNADERARLDQLLDDTDRENPER